MKEIVQVCADVNSDNMKREIDGLIEALVFFDKKEGLIVTHNQKDDFIREGKKVRLVPINELLLD